MNHSEQHTQNAADSPPESREERNLSEENIDAQPEAESPEQGENTEASGLPPQAEEEGQSAGRELEGLRKQAEEHYQRLLRTQADFDNFRRRTRQEKEEQARYASLNLLEQLLPVVDNFDRALASSRDTPDFEALAKGVDMISRQLWQVLEQEGLRAMETVGQPFDPELHQAVMQVESDEHDSGTVVEELQKGYLLKDKVIRPAMVKVSS